MTESVCPQIGEDASGGNSIHMHASRNRGILMRIADATTYFRVGLGILAAYLVIIRQNPVLIMVLIAVVMVLDAADGYFAVWQGSRGRISMSDYLRAVTGDRKKAGIVKEVKRKVAKTASFGPRIDVAGDRVVEYAFWIVYSFVGVIPLFVLMLVVIRHSFVDAFMAAKGTSSKMKTRFARIVYSSNLWRSGINVVKFIAFSYLAFVYVWNWPSWIGYVLVAALVAYILVRGAAEVYESVRA
jgi:phosphatidylglycerophosphate synthase